MGVVNSFNQPCVARFPFRGFQPKPTVYKLKKIITTGFPEQIMLLFRRFPGIQADGFELALGKRRRQTLSTAHTAWIGEDQHDKVAANSTKTYHSSPFMSCNRAFSLPRYSTGGSSNGNPCWVWMPWVCSCPSATKAASAVLNRQVNSATRYRSGMLCSHVLWFSTNRITWAMVSWASASSLR